MCVVDGVKGVVPNTVTFTEKRPPCAGGDVQEDARTDDSLERDGRPDERRIGRLEAVALQGPPARTRSKNILKSIT